MLNSSPDCPGADSAVTFSGFVCVDGEQTKAWMCRVLLLSRNSLHGCSQDTPWTARSFTQVHTLPPAKTTDTDSLGLEGCRGSPSEGPPSPLAHLLSTGTSPLIKGLGQPLQLLLRSRGGGRTSQTEPCAQGWRDKGTPRQGVGSWGWPGVNQQLH